jgi:tetratricopeptide (TPR) repeat protein
MVLGAGVAATRIEARGFVNAATWQRVKQILADAIEQKAEERAELIQRECQDNPALEAEIGELLAEHERAEAGAAFKPRVESYEIVRELGRGGAGVVYLANRTGPFRKQVALKMLASCWPTDDLTRRFHVERQILAGLEHNYIPRLLDGGITAQGLPYLVVEYVNGIPIDEFCTLNGLAVRQRLELMKRVCEAVDYAHRQLIVHRDLKPANILVTAAGEPRLLDFGIAKLLDPGAVTKSGMDLTQHGIHPMTPEYASPEQARGERTGTASDIYSLGVLLYLVLAGRLPYDLKGVPIARAIWVISESEPLLPETIPRDLGAIVIRALAKRPDDRYPSASALGEDIQAWLDGRPVRAATGSRFYSAWKFVMRHRALLAAAAAMLICLLGGLGVALYQRGVAIEQRTRAEASQRHSDELLLRNQSMVRSFVFEAAGRLANLAPDRESRRAVLAQASEMLEKLEGEPDSAAVRTIDVAKAYQHLSRLQSDPSGAGPADPKAAQLSAYRSARLLARVAAKTSGDAALSYLRARSYLYMGDAYFFGGDYAAAYGTYDEAKRRLFRLRAAIGEAELLRLSQADPLLSHVTPGRVPAIAPAQAGEVACVRRFAALWVLADAYVRAGQFGEAYALYKANLEAHRAAFALYPDNFRLQMSRANLLVSVGDLFVRRKDPRQARGYYEAAVRVSGRLQPPNSLEVSHRRDLLAAVTEKLHKISR